MEIVSFAKDVVQNIAEQAAGYKLGQTVLRHLDRALWVVEKCAKWAVPPPLDQDDRPQPELVRPLPWVFFLMMLVTLRVTRESISLFNLVLGKPPLRSADVVMYIQSKRRYLRTLKYQGNRIARARSAQNKQPWYSGLQALLAFTMCFRPSQNYGNNNTTHISNNEEVLVVKRSKRPRGSSSPEASTSEATMERLIEKMMVELDAGSDDDSSYTLTNPASIRSDHSECGSNSDQDTLENMEVTGNSVVMNYTPPEDDTVSPIKSDFASSTPEKSDTPKSETQKSETQKADTPKSDTQKSETPKSETPKSETPKSEVEIQEKREENGTQENETEYHEAQDNEDNEQPKTQESPKENALMKETSPKSKETKSSPKTESKNFLQNESCRQKSPQKSPKFANGRLGNQGKKKGLQMQSPSADGPTTRPGEECL